jgi:transporter family protein
MPRWLLYTLLTVLLWGLWGFTLKVVSSDLPAWQLQVLSLAGLAPVGLVLASMVEWPGDAIGRRAMVWSLAAGVLGSVGNLACFEAMAEGGKAAAVVPLTSLYPITTILLGFLFLKERPSYVQAIGLGLALVAIWLFNAVDGAAILSPWLLVSLLPILCWGVGGFLQKLATFHISGEQCTLGFLLGFLPMTLVILLKDADWAGIPPITWGLAATSGLLLALGNLTVALAYRCGGRAVIVTPVAGLYMLITIPLAITFLSEAITVREACGIAVSVLAVIALCCERPVAAKSLAVVVILVLANSGEALCSALST